MHIDLGASAHPAGRGAELYRLGLQAQVWRPAAEDFLADIGIPQGARAVDLGCGSVGVLGTLSRAVGDTGTVVGVEGSPVRLAAARAYVAEANLRNTSIAEGSPLATGLPSGQFDLVHCRFLFAPFGSPEALLTEMLRILRPGGCIAIHRDTGRRQETVDPAFSIWVTKCGDSRFEEADELSGTGRIVLEYKPSACGLEQPEIRDHRGIPLGRRQFRCWPSDLWPVARCRDAGCVCQRNTVMACYDQHPYKHLPLQFAGWLRSKILDGGLMSE